MYKYLKNLFETELNLSDFLSFLFGDIPFKETKMKIITKEEQKHKQLKRK